MLRTAGRTHQFIARRMREKVKVLLVPRKALRRNRYLLVRGRKAVFQIDNVLPQYFLSGVQGSQLPGNLLYLGFESLSAELGAGKRQGFGHPFARALKDSNLRIHGVERG